MTGKEKNKTIYVTGLEKNQLTLELGGRGRGGGGFGSLISQGKNKQTMNWVDLLIPWN